MLLNILQFEIKYWLRQPMVYVFLLINALLVFFAVSMDNVTIGTSIGNVHKNAPFVVLNLYAFMSLITLLMVTAFTQATILRDFSQKTHEIIFTTPVKKVTYLLGRFLGACVISIIPLLGVSFGILIGAVMPWLDAERVGAVYWQAHLNGLLMFGIPNSFFIAAVIFTIAALTRSNIASFIGAIVLIVGYAVSSNLLSDLQNESLGMLADPFAIGTYSTLTKYWTVSDKNSMVLGWQWPLLFNRLFWLGVGGILLIFTYLRFNFSVNKRIRKKKKGLLSSSPDLEAVPQSLEALPETRLSFQLSAQWQQMFNQARVDFLGIVKSVPFIIILIFGVANMSGGLSTATASFGLTLHPVTYNIISTIRGTMYLFTFALITFYSGALIWKERDANVDQIYDALPHKNWVPAVSKLMAMLGILAIVQGLSILVGIIAQSLYGYTHFELGVYLKEMLVLDFLAFTFLIVMSLLIHTIVNNKYIGFFAFVVFVILNTFIWNPLRIESLMLMFGQTPSYVYSDMNSFGPYVKSLTWFNLYWVLFSGILIVLATLFWMRGKDQAWSKRWHNVNLRFGTRTKMMTFSLIVLWLLTAGFVFYNTQILNTYKTGKENQKLQAEYEKTYKSFEGKIQPRVMEAKYDIAIYPQQRDLEVKGNLLLKNVSPQPIDSLLITTIDGFELRLEIDQAEKIYDDKKLNFSIYKLNPALQSGETINLAFETIYDAKGFENQVSFTQIVPNGTFFNNNHITPQIGYQPGNELLQKKDRKKHDLPEKELMLPLERNCVENCINNYISNHSDWTTLETTISTSSDQIAVAPGSLIKEWTEGDRRFFQYKLDHYSFNYFSFISADYEVARDNWNDVDVEVYYHQGHEYNVDKMVNSIKKSLDYFTANFGPYKHKQARIIEFPRYASFAQAFPGTMPYSEGIGFIAKIEEEDDIDVVFYVVAHEMAHQWWANQVLGSVMEGATLLSETMAQYSSLMVMEKEFGKDQMRKFLKYEMDRYLRGRGAELKEEKPLLRVDANQGYIHYRKGSVVMYYLKEMIGEDKVNQALRTMVDSFGYKQPPYPTSHHLVDLFRAQTPDSLQYLITDLFEHITLFDNRVSKDPIGKKLADGRYSIKLEIQCQKLRADSLGHEEAIPLDDWIDIGVFAKPEEGKKRGETLLLERHRITEPIQTFDLIVNEAPYEAGVDPNFYLIDRMPEDNLKRVKME